VTRDEGKITHREEPGYPWEKWIRIKGDSFMEYYPAAFLYLSDSLSPSLFFSPSLLSFSPCLCLSLGTKMTLHEIIKISRVLWGKGVGISLLVNKGVSQEEQGWGCPPSSSLKSIGLNGFNWL
jgi:hypothetical protein